MTMVGMMRVLWGPWILSKYSFTCSQDSRRKVLQGPERSGPCRTFAKWIKRGGSARSWALGTLQSLGKIQKIFRKILKEIEGAVKQITLHRGGRPRPRPLQGPERSGPCTASPLHTLGHGFQTLQNLNAFFKPAVKIVRGRLCKVRSAPDLAGDGAWDAPLCARWFA